MREGSEELRLRLLQEYRTKQKAKRRATQRLYLWRAKYATQSLWHDYRIHVLATCAGLIFLAPVGVLVSAIHNGAGFSVLLSLVPASLMISLADHLAIFDGWRVQKELTARRRDSDAGKHGGGKRVRKSSDGRNVIYPLIPDNWVMTWLGQIPGRTWEAIKYAPEKLVYCGFLFTAGSLVYLYGATGLFLFTASPSSLSAAEPDGTVSWSPISVRILLLGAWLLALWLLLRATLHLFSKGDEWWRRGREFWTWRRFALHVTTVVLLVGLLPTVGPFFAARLHQAEPLLWQPLVRASGGMAFWYLGMEAVLAVARAIWRGIANARLALLAALSVAVSGSLALTFLLVWTFP